MTRRGTRSEHPFEAEYGYRRAVRVGPHIHVSGTTAREADLGGDALAQARSALSIIAPALAELGASLADVVHTRFYIVDMADLPLVTQAHREAFGEYRPASTLLQVVGLTPQEARVEIEVTAIVGDGA
ncbi:RidA family protein [Luteimonas gilva]|uniref:RidA family protein n=1 Tax=Luteimonas gilva TaxID=2572684 RepID=A0A4U5JJ19_9GAMM|nr:Rid family hydrolase [Luteimonas gilva]TKR29542.1 RidA family protein [Luteimonas gilva]